MTATAGRCLAMRNLIRLSTLLTSEQARKTLLHELAHYVAWHRYGPVGHKEPWRKIMKMFGLPPVRCHNYPQFAQESKIRTKNVFIVTCTRCDYPQGAGTEIRYQIVAGKIRAGDTIITKKKRCIGCENNEFTYLAHRVIPLATSTDTAILEFVEEMRKKVS